MLGRALRAAPRGSFKPKGRRVVTAGATAITMNGPTSGTVGLASSPFGIGANGVVGSNIVVTPSDGGGGTFSVPSVTLTAVAPSATFTYTPGSIGSRTISVTSNPVLEYPPAITFTATGVTALVWGSYPTSGTVSVASTPFTISANGPVGTSIVVTMSDAANGGTFTPTTVTLTTGSPSQTFTYTPGSTGGKTISVTNNQGLTNPASITYTSNAAGGDAEATTNQKYVRQGAAGSGTGNDWTNAYTALPATLARDTTYWVADGTYAAYTFDDAVSGTQVIRIKKATASLHGTDAGWVSTYGDGQATFSSANIYTDYFRFDGSVRNSTWRTGGVNEYGLSFGNVRMDNGGGTGGDNVYFKLCDIHGGGRDTGTGDDVIYTLTGGTNITFDQCALRDSDRCIFLTRGTPTNWTIEYCYIARNTSSPAVHSEMWSFTDGANVIFRFNAVEDIEGTGVLIGINDGTMSGLYVYGNTFRWTDAYIADTGRAPGHNYGIAGVINIINDASNNNFGNNVRFYNNTIYRAPGTYCGVRVEAAGTGNECYNNMWYDTCRCAHTGVTLGYNWYWSIDISDDDSSGTKQVASSGTGVFVNGAAADFHLAAATNAGQSLSSPYNVDADGVTRSTPDRGAYEYI
jgi:hypothetical protein